MKTIIHCLLVFFSLPTFGQTGTAFKASPSAVLGKVTNLATFIGEIDYSIAPGGDTIYTLRYHNYEYTHIEDIQTITFLSKGHALDSLYSYMASVFLPQHKKDKDYLLQFDLGTESVTVSPYRIMGITSARIMKGSSYGLFTEKQLRKLFGRN